MGQEKRRDTAQEGREKEADESQEKRDDIRDGMAYEATCVCVKGEEH